jgi:hypothetical protein
MPSKPKLLLLLKYVSIFFINFHYCCSVILGILLQLNVISNLGLDNISKYFSNSIPLVYNITEVIFLCCSNSDKIV